MTDEGDMEKKWIEEMLSLVCDLANTLDEDFVPGPKLAELENRMYVITGYHRGDVHQTESTLREDDNHE